MGVFREKTINEELEEAKSRLKKLEHNPFFYNHYTNDKIRQLENSLD